VHWQPNIPHPTATLAQHNARTFERCALLRDPGERATQICDGRSERRASRTAAVLPFCSGPAGRQPRLRWERGGPEAASSWWSGATPASSSVVKHGRSEQFLETERLDCAVRVSFDRTPLMGKEAQFHSAAGMASRALLSGEAMAAVPLALPRIEGEGLEIITMGGSREKANGVHRAVKRTAHPHNIATPLLLPQRRSSAVERVSSSRGPERKSVSRQSTATARPCHSATHAVQALAPRQPSQPCPQCRPLPSGRGTLGNRVHSVACRLVGGTPKFSLVLADYAAFFPLPHWAGRREAQRWGMDLAAVAPSGRGFSARNGTRGPLFPGPRCSHSAGLLGCN
jgi:hypothetical protein